MSPNYFEKDGTLEMKCESSGKPFNPLEKGALEDEIGLRLIKARSRSIDYSYDKGRNMLLLRMKGDRR